MGGNPLIVQAGAGLLLLLFIILIVFSAKSWRWHHVTAMVFVFLATFVFTFFAAAVLKTHETWRTLAQEKTEELSQKELEAQELRSGSLTQLEQTEDSLRTVSAALEQELLYRGRVWRHSGASAGQNGTVVATVVQPDAEGNVPPHNVQPNTILYAFAEADVPELGGSVPNLYVGELSVVSANETSLTLRPTLPLDRIQQREFSGPTSRWALYEVMPLDHHTVWTDREPDENHLFGEPVEKYVSRLPEQSLPNYQRSGTPANPDDPPERSWIKIEFLAKHTIKVDSDDDPSQYTNQFFDASGRSTLALLRQGTPTTYEVGDNAFFDLETAQQLINDGIAKKADDPQVKPVGPVNPIYVRPLRAYDLHFHIAFRRDQVLSDEIRATQHATQLVDAAQKKADVQVAYRTEEKRKASEDLEKLEFEKEELEKYQASLQDTIASLKTRLSALYRSNLALQDELTRMDELARQIIDRQTEEAATAQTAGAAAVR